MLFDLKPAARAVACVLLAAAPASLSPARAAEATAFTIEADDGYGIAECMQQASACGQAMANVWCEAHGHARATAFGLGEDVTGVVTAAAGAPTPVAAVVIRCAD